MDIDKAIEALEKIAAAVETPYQHWLGGDDADQGQSYCRPCAEKKVAEGKGEFIDGGYQQDSDVCSHCDDCGRLLEYNLTESGVVAELEHFRLNAPSAPVSAECAFHLVKLLEHHNDNPDVLELLPAVVGALAGNQERGATNNEQQTVLRSEKTAQGEYLPAPTHGDEMNRRIETTYGLFSSYERTVCETFCEVCNEWKTADGLIASLFCPSCSIPFDKRHWDSDDYAKLRNARNKGKVTADGPSATALNGTEAVETQ